MPPQPTMHKLILGIAAPQNALQLMNSTKLSMQLYPSTIAKTRTVTGPATIAGKHMHAGQPLLLFLRVDSIPMVHATQSNPAFVCVMKWCKSAPSRLDSGALRVVKEAKGPITLSEELIIAPHWPTTRLLVSPLWSTAMATRTRPPQLQLPQPTPQHAAIPWG